MKAHVVENGVVVNLIEIDESEDLSLFNAVDLGQYAQIGDTVVDGASVEAAQRESDAIALDAKEAIEEAKAKRNKLLAETDWWVLSDTGTASQEQLDYRQALRDLPAQEGFPDVEFPTKP